jgi:hypothetical protein
MSAADQTKNLGVYRVPALVAHFAGLNHRTGVERLLLPSSTHSQQRCPITSRKNGGHSLHLQQSSPVVLVKVEIESVRKSGSTIL